MVTTSVEAQRNHLMDVLSKNIRQRRVACGLSQDELASTVGVARATINRIEQGHRIPDFDLVCRIADALKCGTDWLRERHKKLAETA